MKILGRIKKSKVLTAVMTAVLIFQSACPTGLAYAAQKSGVSAYAAGQTIDQALGATKTVESVLSQHENDEYYLTTPYGNKGPHGEGGAIDTWDCWKPKGEYGSGAYMNCAGFVVAVLRACGANTSIIGNYTAKDGYNRGNETNASKWDEYCRDNNAVSYTFSSKEQMLASGILEKGDIIYMEPADWNHSNSDCHIGFFWGSNSSEDLFWHSSSHADGIVKGYFPNSAGGNVISKITPKYPVRYYRVIKTLHKGYLTLHKDSSNKTLTDANDCYSLAGAEYGVYTDSNCSNKVATLTTNVSGNANTVSLNPGRYYVKETKAPKGYKLNSNVYEIKVTETKGDTNVVVENGEAVRVTEFTASAALLLNGSEVAKTENGENAYPTVTEDALAVFTVKKVWVDNNAKTGRTPVEISLSANGKQIEKFELNDKNGWEKSFELAKYDENGKEIKYTAAEITKVTGYVTGYSSDTFTVYNTLESLKPKTGDDSNLTLWTMLGLSALLCAGGVGILMYKKSRNAG